MDEVEADFGPDDRPCAGAMVTTPAAAAGLADRAQAPGGRAARNLGGPVGSVRYTAAVARRIVMRVETGESLRAICADPDMPHRGTVTAWARRAPRFAASIRRAREAAGWRFETGRPPKWDEAAAREVCRRVAEGEALSRVCEDPGLPSLGVVYKWRNDDPAFAAAMRLAREVAAERFCDLGWEIACGITPETAYATHVKLTQLRWTAATLAPRRFGRIKPVTGEAEAEMLAETAEPREVVFRVRHFQRVVGPDGKAYVEEVPEMPEEMARGRAARWQDQPR